MPVLDFLKNIVKKPDKLLNVLLWAVLALFFMLYSSVIYFNGLRGDDYHFAASFRDYGVFGTVRHVYFAWQGRFAHAFISTIITGLSVRFPFLVQLNTLFGIILWVWVSYKLLTGCFPGLKPLMALLAALLFVFTAVCTNLQPSIFFMTVGLHIYFFPILFFKLALVLLLKEKASLWDGLLIGLCAFIVGGSNELYSLVLTGVAFAAAFFLFRKLSRKPLIFRINSGIFLFTALVSVLLMLSAPGNEIRRAAFTRPSFAELFRLSRTFVLYFFEHHLYRTLYQVIFLMPFLYLGMKSRTYPQPENSRFITGVLTFSTPFIIALLTVGTMLTLVFLTGGYGALRVYTLSYVVGAFCIAAALFLVGRTEMADRTLIRIMTFLSVPVVIFLLSRDLKNTLETAPAYDRALQKRFSIIKKYKETKTSEALQLTPLPLKPKFFWEDEITDKPKDPKNLKLNRFFEVNFDIRLDKNPEKETQSTKE